jgi:predicted AAA+ superfamily ATPase|tara:strand:- start:876 stop:1202 length:327 start_codon:yes stop_codon:yes gene_type:complete
MSLKVLKKNDLKLRLITLMDDVRLHLDKEPDVDKFLDETDIFDEWEMALPQYEYPILVMAVLNNIRKDSIIDSIIDTIMNQDIPSHQIKESKTKSKRKRSYVGEHPFS